MYPVLPHPTTNIYHILHPTTSYTGLFIHYNLCQYVGWSYVPMNVSAGVKFV